MTHSSYSLLTKVTPLLLGCFLFASASAQSLIVNTNTVVLNDNQARSIQVTASGASTVSYSATGAPFWLSVSSQNGFQTPDTLFFQLVNTNCGTCAATVTLTPTAGGTAVPVTIAYSPGSTGNGTLAVSSSSLTYTGTPGGAASNQNVTLSTTSNSVSITGIGSDAPTWLTAFISAGSFTVTPSASAILTITANPFNLSAGTYTGHITITPGNGTATTITVTFNVSGSAGTLTVNPSSLAFTAAAGQTSLPQNLTISNPTTTAVSVGIGSDVTWLSAQVVSGTVSSVTNASPLVISVAANAGTLTNGTYTGHLLITPGVGTPTAVTVTFTVGTGGGSNGTITANPTSLSFTAPAGQNAAAQNLTLNSATAVTILGINSNVSWLSTTITTGSLTIGPTAPGNLSIVASAAALSNGTYNGQLTITPSAGTPTIITVTFTVGTGSGGGTGSIQVDHTSFAFNYPSSTLSAVLNISSGTSGQNTFNLVLASQGNWLRFSVNNVPSGTYNNVGFGQFLVSVDLTVASTLATGTYTGTISLLNPSNSSDITIVNLTLIVNAATNAPNTISASPAALSFTASPGGAIQAQTLAILPTTTDPVQLLVTSYNGAFFTISSPSCNGSPASTFQCTFTGSQSLNIAVNPGNLTTLGTYSASFQFQSGTSTKTVYLTLILANPVNTLTIAPTSLSFASLIGGSAQTQAVSVRVPGNASVLTTLTSSGGNFFTISSSTCNTNPISNATCTFTGNQTLYVSVTPGLFGAGTYSGNIAFQSSGATINLPITLTINSSNTGGNTIAAPAALSFAYQVGSAATIPQQVITVAGSGTISASAMVSTSQQWLVVTTAGNYIQVSVGPQALSAGTYSGAVSITTPAGTTVVPVTLTVTLAPVVFATPGTINFSAQPASSPVTQSITFLASDNSALSVLPTSAAPWITLSPSVTLTTPATFTATVNASTLCNGLNSGSIIVAASGAGNSGFAIPVVVQVTNSSATNCPNGNSPLSLSPTSLSFAAQVGAAPVNANLTVVAPTSNTAYTVGASNVVWLSVQPGGSLTGNSTLTVTVNPVGLAAGTYTGAITFNTNGLAQTVPVTMVLAPAVTTTSATPSVLNFTAIAGQVAPFQTVVLSSTSVPTIFVTELGSDSPNWLTASLQGGGSLSAATPVSITVAANATALAAGSYLGHITVRTSAGTTTVITVNFTVSAFLPSITADRTSLQFAFPGITSQQLTIRSTNVAVTTVGVIVASQGNWLRFGGQGAGTYQNLQLGTYTVTVDPAIAGGLATGTYTGSLGLINPANPTEIVTVSATLSITTGNLALGKTATQSSKVFGYYDGGPAAAIDGNTDGNFFHSSVSHTNPDPNAWWQVDLGTSAIVNTIVIWNRTDCCSSRLSDYWIFVSDVPFLATDTPATLQNRAATFASHQSDNPNPNISIGIAARGRYVRIQLSGTNSLALAEVQVFGTTLTNLSHGRPATQSSTLAGYTTTGASYAVDGNTDGSFFNGSVTHTNTDANAWWQVDLGASAAVTSVTIWNRTDCCSSRLTDYWVFVSDTPFLATDTPATLQNRASTFYSHQTTAPNPSVIIPFMARGRYVRVQLSGTDNLSLAEVEVYGTGGSPAPPNLAQNKLATQSSTLPEYGSTYAGVAVDGNTDGNFFNRSVTHTNADANAWWQVDLGASQTIGNVVVWNRTDCCSSRLGDYWVFVSDVPFLATDTPASLQNRANTFSSHQTAVPSPSATIPVNAPGRFVRVQLSGTNNLSLAEVQVFGQ